MEFPDRESIRRALDPEGMRFPPFARVRYEPDTPTVEDPATAAREALAALPGAELEGRVAVCLGSRGIHDVVPIATAVVDALRERGCEPVAVPAMGSHGGATADGQRRALAELGLTEETLGCPVDARMDTEVVGTTDAGDEVHVARSVLEADAVVAVNRVKPHTNFTGRVESGLSKMLTVGVGKQPGAGAFHRRALGDGYVTAIEATLPVVLSAAPVVGGVAIVENFQDRTAAVEGVPAGALPGAEAPLLERAREYMPTLPHEDLDALVLDRIGKDVSGTGMDTNVVGRYEVLNADNPATPDIDRIVVRGLTEASDGNANGIGLADLTTRRVAEATDLGKVYTNSLTSGSLARARLPVVLPDDELAVAAALTTAGPYDPETARVAWIRDTGHLTEYRASAALLEELPPAATVEQRLELRFVDGEPRFEGRSG
jgi:hypothetical protein